MRGHRQGVPRLAAIAGCVLACLLAAGCGGGSPVAGLFGAGGAPGERGGGVSILAASGTAAPADPAFDDPVVCPRVEVIEGGSSLRLGAGAEGARTQLSLGEIARECTPRPGGGYVLKVGVEVSALLGAGGAAGRFDAPVRVLVKRGERVVASRVRRGAITIPAGDTRGSAVVIEEGILVPAADADEELDILVGLEGGAAASGRRRR